MPPPFAYPLLLSPTSVHSPSTPCFVDLNYIESLFIPSPTPFSLYSHAQSCLLPLNHSDTHYSISTYSFSILSHAFFPSHLLSLLFPLTHTRSKPHSFISPYLFGHIPIYSLSLTLSFTSTHTTNFSQSNSLFFSLSLPLSLSLLPHSHP